MGSWVGRFHALRLLEWRETVFPTSDAANSTDVSGPIKVITRGEDFLRGLNRITVPGILISSPLKKDFRRLPVPTPIGRGIIDNRIASKSTRRRVIGGKEELGYRLRCQRFAMAFIRATTTPAFRSCPSLCTN